MADKWIQLMSEDGTDNLFPTTKMDLLWENASPTTSIGSGVQLTFDTSNYDLFFVQCLRIANNSPEPAYSSTLFRKNVVTSVLIGCIGDSSSLLHRAMVINDSGLLTKSRARNQNDSAFRDDAVIPNKVYGIKLIED